MILPIFLAVIFSLTHGALSFPTVISSDNSFLVLPRAIAPRAVAIPPSCNYTYPTNGSIPYYPSNSTINSTLTYAFNLPYPRTASLASEFQTCAQNCYGYGTQGSSCKAAYIADNVPTSSGELIRSCLLFSEPLSANGVVAAETNGLWANGTGVNIGCPPSVERLEVKRGTYWWR